MPANKTISLTIPHRLTREQARQRIQRGVEQFRATVGNQVAQVQESWTGDHLDFRCTALGQTVTGRVDVGPEDVLINVDLPWLLAALAGRIRPQIQNQASRLLK